MSLFTLPFWASMLGGAAPKMMLVSALACGPAQKAPTVSLVFTPAQPQVTHTLDHQALGQFSVSTQFSHHKNEVFLTGGITESNIRTEYNVSFEQHINPNTNQACLYVDHIELQLKYDPIVHIASNYPQGSCRFKTTWQHELLHVNTDLITLNERKPLLEQAAKQVAQKLTVIGPVDTAALPVQQQAVIDQVGAAVQATFASIDTLRMQRQQLIDTREEYLRLSKACP